jgi:hypothetical protein
MAVSCRRRIQALWCNEEESNAWVWLSGAGWRKLDDRHRDACTDLLAIAALAKGRNVDVMVREELRNNVWFITEMYDFSHGGTFAPQEVSFAVTECTFGWTAAFLQQGTHVTARIQLNPDADVSASLLAEVKDRWKRGIEDKWSYRFACCQRPGCVSACALTFEVQWTNVNPHLMTRVKRGGGRSNLGLWHTDDSGDVASHEFGHLMGHPDEYSEPAVCPNRTPVNTGTVMDDNTEVVQRLCTPFCNRQSQDTTPA